MKAQIAGFISCGVGLLIYGLVLAYSYGKLNARVDGQDKAVKEAKEAADDKFIHLYDTVIEHLRITGADNTRIEKALSRIEEALEHLPCESRGEKIDEIDRQVAHMRGQLERPEP